MAHGPWPCPRARVGTSRSPKLWRRERRALALARAPCAREASVAVVALHVLGLVLLLVVVALLALLERGQACAGIDQDKPS